MGLTGKRCIPSLFSSDQYLEWQEAMALGDAAGPEDCLPLPRLRPLFRSF